MPQLETGDAKRGEVWSLKFVCRQWGSAEEWAFSSQFPGTASGDWRSRHMSAEPKWCFLNCSKGGTNIFALRTPHWFRGYVSPNQIHLLFGTFGQKMGQKGLKMGLKCLGLVWYGLAWAACDPGSWLSPKLCSKLSKIARLKVWLLGLREES